MAETVTLAAVEAGFHELADAIEGCVQAPRSLAARTMLGAAVSAVAGQAARAVKGLDAAQARERDLIARLQEAEARYQARQTELLAQLGEETLRANSAATHAEALRSAALMLLRNDGAGMGPYHADRAVIGRWVLAIRCGHRVIEQADPALRDEIAAALLRPECLGEADAGDDQAAA